LTNCTNCGANLPDDAFFCPKCGTKTPKGAEANANYPYDEMREAFAKVGVELERAFTIAGKEMQAAFQKVRENMTQKTTKQDTIVCSKCDAKNEAGAIFCRNCGNKIAS
jgi:ribosomal protein L40E